MHHQTDRITHTTAFVTPVRGALAGTRNDINEELDILDILNIVAAIRVDVFLCVVFSI